MTTMTPKVGWLMAALLLLPRWAHACATCFGAPDAAMTKGLNMGILSLLVVVLFVLGMAGSFAIYLARKAASVPPVEPEDARVGVQTADKVH